MFRTNLVWSLRRPKTEVDTSTGLRIAIHISLSILIDSGSCSRSYTVVLYQQDKYLLPFWEPTIKLLYTIRCRKIATACDALGHRLDGSDGSKGSDYCTATNGGGGGMDP